jgi:glycerol-3-phosphate O-acyltransferase / dihydroxyacetone phosphate acyltransferase
VGSDSLHNLASGGPRLLGARVRNDLCCRQAFQEDRTRLTFLFSLYLQLLTAGSVFDTYDEIAQYKLTYGLASGLLLWFAAVALTLPFGVITFFAAPALAWLTLRWLEDAVSALRASVALWHLVNLSNAKLESLQQQREGLRVRIAHLARRIGLPEDPEAYYVKDKGKREKGQSGGRWRSKAQYFSLRRRRKRDWNETMRWYDVVDYPEDDSLVSL